MSVKDNASIALIPSGYKSVKLYSVIPDSGNGDFTHSRGSTATRVAASGLIETVASGVPRLDYPLVGGVVQTCPALLLEPSRTNIALYSEDFTNAAWIKQRTTITGNQAVSPDGSVTADKVTGTGTGASYFYDGFSVSSGTVYTISIFAKKINVDNFYINNFSQAGSITFDLSDGTIDSSASGTFSNGKIKNYGNDWYRLSVQYTASATASVNIGFYGQNYSGDGAFAWGAQIETGSYVTSYIPTTNSSVTRSADVCNGSGTSAEFNDTESSLFVEIQGLAEDNTNRYIVINDGAGFPYTNSLSIQYRSNGTLRIFHNGLDFADAIFLSGSSFDQTANHKIAIRYKQNDMKVYIDGVSQSLSSSFVYQSISGLNKFSFDLNGALSFVGKVKQAMVFKTALTDSELQALTS